MKKLMYGALFLASFVFIGTQGDLFCMGKQPGLPFGFIIAELPVDCGGSGTSSSSSGSGAGYAPFCNSSTGTRAMNSSSDANSEGDGRYSDDGNRTCPTSPHSAQKSTCSVDDLEEPMSADFVNPNQRNILAESDFVKHISSMIVIIKQAGFALQEETFIKNEITKNPYKFDETRLADENYAGCCFTGENHEMTRENAVIAEAVCCFVAGIISQHRERVQNGVFQHSTNLDQVGWEISLLMVYRLQELVDDTMNGTAKTNVLEFLSGYSQEVEKVVTEMVNAFSLEKEVTLSPEMPSSGSCVTLVSPATVRSPGPSPSLPGAPSIGDLAERKSSVGF